MTSWIAAVTLDALDERLGVEAVALALDATRVYAEPPAKDASGRLVAGIVPVQGKRLSAPFRVVVRIEDEVIAVACACRHSLAGPRAPRICEHAIWLLVDVAVHPELRAALEAGEPTSELARDLPAKRTRALEARTLEERLAAWRPARKVDDAFAIDVEVGPGDAGRAAVFLRHRLLPSRALVPARDVLGARLSAWHRRIVELMAPHHLDRNALVATRGQASVVAHLLRDLRAEGLQARLRYSDAEVRLKADREGDRLVARWYSRNGLVGDAETFLLLVGPHPYVWAPATRTFHPVSPEVDLDVALGMQRVPSLPLDDAAHVGRSLLLGPRAPGVELPPAEDFGLPPIAQPSFELRISGTPLEVVGELVAVYGIGKLPIGDRAGDRAAEDLALARIHEAGFVSTERGLVASEERAVELWQNGLAKLRASEDPRFHVLVAESLSRTMVGPPVEVDVRVRGEVGWLDTELEFRAGALKIEKARMHAALASNQRWVVLSDGSLARIADDVAALVGIGTPHRLSRIARLSNIESTLVHFDKKVIRMEPGEARLPANLALSLRAYQLVGVAWLQHLHELGAGGLLADDMGLGKTLMTLAFLARWKEDAGIRPSLLVCPTSLVGNWIREAERCTPGLRVGTSEDADVMVTTYGLLRRDANRLAKRRFRCVVLDEAQNAKNHRSETSRAVRKLDAEMRIALSGTPVENRLAELWSLMTFANPGLLGTLDDFDERYEQPIAMRPDGAVAADLRAVVRPFILRRTKAEVLADLPSKTEIERACVFGAEQRRLYDALALAVREAVRKDIERREGARVQLAVLTAILRLRQMACDPRLVDATATAPSAKRAAFLDLVRELVSEGRRALVFSQFVELLRLWREDLDDAKIPYEWLDGSTRDRDAAVARFQEGNAPLFLISLKAGGAGLNLTAADTVIHCDPWWNPAVEDQATDRAHRIGQTRPVTLVRLVAQGTIEEKIRLLKRSKQELAAAVLEDIDTFLGDAEGAVDDDARAEK